ncbi:MAG: response regulator [Calditrichaeota bacterium]|nr:response regulator [Calditrichota bacterium]MCB0289292.1 response regulator [Calditrichota bacterium]MCB0302289.1 response regulator [Calditrichota bacterium]MCB0316090.1 response regulator [Calditrichota bacterium]MCB9086782.1 response regulator [Calditrichia bacterium]
MLENHIVTILLAEDNPGHARLIEKNLRRANINNEIVKFTDGKQVIDYLFEAADHFRLPLLVLLDLNLPVLSGYQVLKRMKSSPKTRNIPVVILTTTEEPHEVAHCYELGCNVYITKPVEYDEFCEAIRKLGLFLSIVKIPEREG